MVAEVELLAAGFKQGFDTVAGFGRSASASIQLALQHMQFLRIGMGVGGKGKKCAQSHPPKQAFELFFNEIADTLVLV